MSEIKTSDYKCRTNTRNHVVSLIFAGKFGFFPSPQIFFFCNIQGEKKINTAMHRTHCRLFVAQNSLKDHVTSSVSIEASGVNNYCSGLQNYLQVTKRKTTLKRRI